MKQKTILVLMMLLAIFGISGSGSETRACVGKSLLIGTTGTVQQDLLAEIIAILISERTGTNVKVVQFDSAAAVHEALLKADLDIAVQYTGAGQLEVLKGPRIADPQQLFDAVKGRYNEELNLVWLQPFGFNEPRAVTQDIPAQAAPVIRKDTLKKFPALARLVNKLGGTIDAAKMQRLEAAADKGKTREVARDFLKTSQLI